MMTGSKCLARSAVRYSRTRSSSQAWRYGRSERSASHTSAATQAHDLPYPAAVAISTKPKTRWNAISRPVERSERLPIAARVAAVATRRATVDRATREGSTEGRACFHSAALVLQDAAVGQHMGGPAGIPVCPERHEKAVGGKHQHRARDQRKGKFREDGGQLRRRQQQVPHRRHGKEDKDDHAEERVPSPGQHDPEGVRPVCPEKPFAGGGTRRPIRV
jgi:hypothetical protein